MARKRVEEEGEEQVREDHNESARSSFDSGRARRFITSSISRTKSVASATVNVIRRGSIAILSTLKESSEISDVLSDPPPSPDTAPPKPVIRPEDLIVIAFEQTPFSQRYHDAVRADQQRLRDLVQLVVDDERDEYNDVVLGPEVDVPDHLAGSPLCPLHPSHPGSRGRGICPQHGLPRSAAALARLAVGEDGGGGGGAARDDARGPGSRSAVETPKARSLSAYGLKRMEPVLPAGWEEGGRVRRWSRVGSDGNVSHDGMMESGVEDEEDWDKEERHRGRTRYRVNKVPGGWRAPEGWEVR